MISEYKQVVNKKADLLANISLVVMFFSFPISRGLFNSALACMIVGVVFSGSYSEKLNLIRRNPIFKPILVIVLTMLVGSLYTNASREYLVIHFFVYIKLFYMLCTISILKELKWIKYCFFAFSAAMLITLISTYLNVWFELPWSKTNAQGFGNNHAVFKDYIVQGLTMSFFVLVLLNYAFDAKKKYVKIISLGLAALAIVSVSHLGAGRTGYLALFAGLSAYVFCLLPNRYKIYGGILTVVSLSILFISSSLLQERMMAVISEARDFRNNPFTSSGARLYMWDVALQLYFEAPFFGNGTASYHELARVAFNNKSFCEIACFHPHNQFLFFAVEHGTIGVLMLCYFIFRPFKFALGLDNHLKALIIGFLAIFIVDCFTHGPLWLRMESYFFVYTMGLLMSYANIKNKNTNTL